MKNIFTNNQPARFRAFSTEPNEPQPGINDPQPAESEPLFEPFPEPNTIPSGWDLSDVLSPARAAYPPVVRWK